MHEVCSKLLRSRQPHSQEVTLPKMQSYAVQAKQQQSFTLAVLPIDAAPTTAEELERKANRKRRLQSAAAWLLALLIAAFGLGLFVSTAVRSANQAQTCSNVVGSTIWSRTAPKVLYADGWFSPSACGFSVITSLDLHAAGLKQLPAAISLYSSLQLLDVSFNALTSFPPELLGLTQLTTLLAKNNSVAVVPLDQARFFGSLPRVDFANNPVALALDWSRQNISDAQLPTKFLALLAPTMQQLQLSGNHLHAFPNVLLGYSKLHVLDLSDNSLIALPTSLPTVMPHLQQLRLARNPFTSLDNVLFSSWTALQLCNISHTASPLPVEILSLPCAVALDLQGVRVPSNALDASSSDIR